jgi:putative transposase
MTLADLLKQHFAADYEECWERERTATPVRAFGVRLHAAGLSLRKTEAVLLILGVRRSFQSIYQWVHRVADSGSDPPMAQPRRVAVDETAVKINGE